MHFIWFAHCENLNAVVFFFPFWSSYVITNFFSQSDTEEYQAACKLWEVYLQTKNEFVQPGDGEEDDEDGDDLMDNPAMSTEDEVM